MDYFNYLFSDKKAFKIWIPFYAGVFFYIGLYIVLYFKGEQAFENKYEVIYPLFLLSFSFLSFFIFYTTGFINLKRQEKFLKKYSSLIKNDSIHQREVEFFRSSYNINGFRTNWQATIKPKAKLDIFTVFEMDNKIGLFGRTYDFGFFKRDLCPILIDTQNYDNLEKFKFATNPKISTINWTDNNMEIVFKRSVFGIRKIKLIDWKKTN